MRARALALGVLLTATPALADVAIVEDGDVVMNAAIAEARRHLAPALRAHVGAKARPGEVFMVKVEVPIEGAGKPQGEHIWVGAVARSGSALQGVLENAPRWFEGEMGGRIVFDPAQVSDWMLICGDTWFGGWTGRALHRIQGTAPYAEWSPDPVPIRYRCP